MPSASSSMPWHGLRRAGADRPRDDRQWVRVPRVELGGRLHASGATPPSHGPYTPRTNGKAERFIQTLLREWAYAGLHHLGAPAPCAPPWLRYYNTRRPHTALQNRVAMSRFQEALP